MTNYQRSSFNLKTQGELVWTFVCTAVSIMIHFLSGVRGKIFASDINVWDEVKASLDGLEFLKFGEVDCAFNQSLCDEFEIRMNPSFLVFDKTRWSDIYYGPRTFDAFSDYLKNIAGLHNPRSLPARRKRSLTGNQVPHETKLINDATFNSEVAHGLTLVM